MYEFDLEEMNCNCYYELNAREQIHETEKKDWHLNTFTSVWFKIDIFL